MTAHAGRTEGGPQNYILAPPSMPWLDLRQLVERFRERRAYAGEEALRFRIALSALRRRRFTSAAKPPEHPTMPALA